VSARPKKGKGKHGKACGKGKGRQLVSTHLGPKFNVAVINHGGTRGRYGDLFIADLYNMPAAIILACEMDDNTHREMLLIMDEWNYAKHPLHLQAPRQGFAEEDRTVRWCSSGLLGELTVFGRNSDVEQVVPGPLWPDTDDKQKSPLLTARVRFRKSMSTGNEIVVCVGHLHRETAKNNGPKRKAFWDQLAVLCVGGARIVGLDANMAVCGVLEEMATRRV